MSARRPKGEGSVYRTADGDWHASIHLGTRPDGRRDRRHVRGRTKTEVAKKLSKLREDRDKGVTGGGRTLTVALWCETWLESCKGRLKPRTYDSYEQYVALYIRPYLGAKQLDRLSRADVEAMFASMARQPKKRGKAGETLSPGTVAAAKRVLRACLAEAERRGLCARNAASDARPATRHVVPEVEPLSRDEAQRVIVAATRRRNGARWVLALALGLRQGEALGLAWDDLDLDAAVIRVRRTLYRSKWQHGCGPKHPCGLFARSCPLRVNGGLQVGTPKSTSGARTFALPPSVAVVLRQHRKAQAAERMASGELWEQGAFGGWVFAGPTGHPLDSRGDWSEWKSLLTEAGVREVRVHDARHTAATLALLSGTPDRIVMARMGWSQVSMLTRYQHSITEADQAAAQAMDDTLFGQSSRPKPRRRRSG